MGLEEASPFPRGSRPRPRQERSPAPGLGGMERLPRVIAQAGSAVVGAEVVLGHAPRGPTPLLRTGPEEKWQGMQQLWIDLAPRPEAFHIFTFVLPGREVLEEPASCRAPSPPACLHMTQPSPQMREETKMGTGVARLWNPQWDRQHLGRCPLSSPSWEAHPAPVGLWFSAGRLRRP